ncbi:MULTISPECIES: GNAT family N-acetyltransferase [Microbacterium]|uniref:GNAT family N-acetyltransferase n=1 Tax=Microbacterium TaxID=33882 RepID=UPI002789C4AE|nr:MULTISPECIES: GNAT family N-acetyltransferase [Microbacterium]MDQ1084859.1 RimJ/RimL family protein N-acetyltransferase/quinol monooxygenase YgiN [Microbacterium sp. SORGH_AS_0344]MDQ1169861.1 RimJ/RimL family protein N-acetyltransferase/quinol monooxygenase YgiN [Microbacterium proteolyticum]
MPLSLTRLDATGRDREELIAFLTSNAFPFHVRSHPTRTQVAAAIDEGTWGGDAVEAFWLDDGEHGRVGLVRLDDLADATALIDLRLAERWRGHGIGTRALALASEHVFRTRPGVVRFEGQTREDNIAMQRTFDKSGWVREAYYRDGWPVEGGAPMASIAYSVLRRDWLSGVTTPVPRGPEVTLSGELRCANEGEAARVRALLPEHIALTRAEPGCLAFDVAPTADARVWRVDERFIDEAAFDAHQRRVAASAWGSETVGIERRYVIRGRARDGGRPSDGA